MLGRPTDDHVNAICQPGRKAACCRYLASDGNGWACVKFHDAGRVIEARVAAGSMVARGDNCSGPPLFETEPANMEYL